ncbi:hypothetical protein GJAV_G00028400 [Gymnothorax javanicus]|nr:hypothetical protein GJAV_G00028400 [Gymnothorax javanicus]
MICGIEVVGPKVIFFSWGSKLVSLLHLVILTTLRVCKAPPKTTGASLAPRAAPRMTGPQRAQDNLTAAACPKQTHTTCQRTSSHLKLGTGERSKRPVFPLEISEPISMMEDRQQSGTLSKHGYSSSRRSRKATGNQVDSASECNAQEEYRMEPRPNMEPVTQRQVDMDINEGQPISQNLQVQATSWARIASLPPKKTIPRKITSGAITSSQKEDQLQSTLEPVSKKRHKKKKKSKKANDDSQVENSGPPPTEQRPPQFQDEGEFPELAPVSVSSVRGLSRTSNIFSSSDMAKKPKENGQESAPQQDVGRLYPDKLKGQTPSQKPPPTAETTELRKGQQRCEKSGGKKSKVPVQLDLGSMLTVLEQRQQSPKSKHDTNPIVLSVGGTLPVAHKGSSAHKKHPMEQLKVPHNPLDSTSPLVKKGKQREVPKVKKTHASEKDYFKGERGEEAKPLGDLHGLSDFPNPVLHESAHPEDHELEQEIAEKGTHVEVCLPCRPKIHSRKFRDYCSQLLSKDVDECVTILLKELVRFQDRLYQKDPMKARMKRRLVMGLREVLKHLKLRKVKCVIISPNCERIQTKGGLDDALHNIIDTCREQSVPFVFALSRKALGRCVNKAVPVSLVGIFNYDGAQDHYHNMIELSSQARKAYEVMIANLEKSEEEQKIPVDHDGLTETVGHSENEEPEYIKIWKKMLDKECNNPLLNFEKQLVTVCEAMDSRLQVDEEGGS